MEIRLTEKDKEQLRKDWRYYRRLVNLSAGNFWAEWHDDSTEILSIFLGKKVADMIGIESPELWKIPSKNCILIEPNGEKIKTIADLAVNGGMEFIANGMTTYEELFKITELCSDSATLSDFRIILQACGYTNVNEIMHKMYALHFTDILFGNISRNASSYGVKLNADKSGSLVSMDNENMLYRLPCSIIPTSFSKDDVEECTEMTEVEYFIGNADEDVRQIIDILMKKFSVRNVWLMMNAIERETNCKFACKKGLLMNYLHNYIMVKKVIASVKAKSADGESGKRKKYSL